MAFTSTLTLKTPQLHFRSVQLTSSDHILIRPRSETRHKTLEEIAAAFGDKVVEVGEGDVEAEGSVLEEKAGARHVETEENV